MAYWKQMSTLLYLLIITLSAQADETGAKTEAEIQTTEKQVELFKQINQTTEENVTALADNNDKVSKLDIDLVKDIQKQAEEPNGTEVINDQLEGQNSTRDGENDDKKLQPSNLRDNSDKYFKDQLLIQAATSQKHKNRLVNRIKMEARVAEWVKKKKTQAKSSSSSSSE